MRRIPYCRTPAPTGDHPHGSVPRKANDRARSHFLGTAEVARRSPSVFPAPDRVPHACPERPENERSPPACVGRRSMDGDARTMSPVWTRSGSRPKIMVARFVTPDRDLLRRPFVSFEVRSGVRDRRLEWPPVRRVPTCNEPYEPPCESGMGGWSRYGTVKGRWRPRTVRRTSVPRLQTPRRPAR